jgi:hypothetical protein
LNAGVSDVAIAIASLDPQQLVVCATRLQSEAVLHERSNSGKWAIGPTHEIALPPAPASPAPALPELLDVEPPAVLPPSEAPFPAED